MAVRINENYLLLKSSYLFADIGRRVRKFQDEHPDKPIIRMGIGDVTRPLVPAIVDHFQQAVAEMGRAETFRGYGPEQGYAFLIREIIAHDYFTHGIHMNEDEVFVSDGAKCDTANIQEIFGLDNTIAVTDPVYPVYVDSNVMAGRSGAQGEDGRYEKMVYLPSTEENGFVPELPKKPVDIIYLCFPNNPTGNLNPRSIGQMGGIRPGTSSDHSL
jgi:LL-diaminopimelate aminotransferase